MSEECTNKPLYNALKAMKHKPQNRIGSVLSGTTTMQKEIKNKNKVKFILIRLLPQITLFGGSGKSKP